ncbi:MAG: ABC transporter ATP-binding protein [Pseudonocardia sp.]
MHVRVAGLRVEIETTQILADVSLEVGRGEFVGLLGPNGSGKSTLLRSVYRALRPRSGAVLVGGDDIWTLSPRTCAQRTAVVVQESAAEFDLDVLDVVSMGRTPHKRSFDRSTPTDERLCLDALRRVGLDGFEGRDFATLSGGEKQRVQVARALAQQSRVLVLDEPTNHLDVSHQLEVLALVASLGLTAIAAMHDLGLAADHCDRVYVLRGGHVVASGPPHDVLDENLVARVFGVRLRRWVDPEDGRTRLAFDRLPRRGGSATADADRTPSAGERGGFDTAPPVVASRTA